MYQQAKPVLLQVLPLLVLLPALVLQAACCSILLSTSQK
jgi:hypothetical protein